MAQEKSENNQEILRPTEKEDRHIGPLTFMSMWVSDGVNLGNMTLGASLLVAGAATLNMVQTFVAAGIAIAIISIVFALNDRPGYRTGIPYVIQLRQSFGRKGTVFASLFRAIPGVFWYGVQSWIGGTALNEIVKFITKGTFNNIGICFAILVAVQIGLSLFGFGAVKWVGTIASVVIGAGLIYVFIVLLQSYPEKISHRWVEAKGTWGLPFFGFIMVFMGNYAATFLSAADYSRELKPGISDTKRGLLYFSPIFLAYGFVLTIGAMLSAATGDANPVKAFSVVVDNDYIKLGMSAFIVLGVIATNMVANIVAPTYVITLLTKMKYKTAAIITGLIACCTFPWLLVKDQSASNLNVFVLIYCAFLGPIAAIMLIEYYVLRKQKLDIDELYKKDGIFSGINWAAVLALLVGAGAAFIQLKLAWLIGFIIGGIVYWLLMKFAFKKSLFKRQTRYE
ncbi:NCS1 family transporter [Aciduricibacillus chroicocephali]|uniref:NCS1 family transporter n=1 Tax=Aciduricibacillus chroicocephali TaxID=3054939 RepID=A0ABY9KWW3_9BACI|nr:NCS1 family transporter [Bacillaceae bacterium 44XB]